MNTQVCFKGDGTRETGTKIIKALRALGGQEQIARSNYTWQGRTDYYYWVKDGMFRNDEEIPAGYTVSNPDDYLENGG